MLIIILALLLMRISFIEDLPSRTLNYKTYLEESGSVKIPIAWDKTGEDLTNLESIIKSRYSAGFDVQSFSATDDITFDSG